MTTLECKPLAPFQRHPFWTTQPDACGVQPHCVNECGLPGLQRIDEPNGQTLATNDWIRSLAINMLLTDARRNDTTCGHRPGTINGHWSESYIKNGSPIGSSIRYIDSLASIREVVQLIQVDVQTTLQKLVKYKIAISVEVIAEYVGNNTVSIVANILDVHGQSAKVGLSAGRSQNEWAWNT